MKSLVSLLLLSSFVIPLSAYERSDAFLVDIYDAKVRVVGPNKHKRNMHAIFKNRTLSEIRGKVQLKNGTVIEYFTLKPEKKKSINLSAAGKNPAYFIAMSPPFQEVRLITGKKPYEIPPKK